MSKKGGESVASWRVAKWVPIAQSNLIIALEDLQKQLLNNVKMQVLTVLKILHRVGLSNILEIFLDKYSMKFSFAAYLTPARCLSEKVQLSHLFNFPVA